MISMAVYGAMLATTSGGASVSIERALGWSRQLRLTPLRPDGVHRAEAARRAGLGLASIVVVLRRRRRHRQAADAGCTSGSRPRLIAWVGSLVFAAFGLFMGYLLPSENVMQILGPVLALLAFARRAVRPAGRRVARSEHIARVHPDVRRSAELAHGPLTGEPSQSPGWSTSSPGWSIFALGAAWRFRKDTARV